MPDPALLPGPGGHVPRAQPFRFQSLFARPLASRANQDQTVQQGTAQGGATM